MAEDLSPLTTEWVASTSPFRVGRRVRWGECDPAGVVYTGRFPDFFISATELFMAHALGGPLQETKAAHGFGTPAKAINLVFHRPLKPDEVFFMEVTAGEFRTRSFDLHVRAYSTAEQLVFEGGVTLIGIALDERRSIPIPESVRQILASLGGAAATKSPQDSHA